jgi:thiol-disulfide isomerase/thioredoxin
MAERALILVAVVGLAVFGVLLARAWSARRARRLMAGNPDALWRSLNSQPDGRATLVAFSTPSCATCRTAQAPAIERARQQLGADSVRIIKIDAAREKAVADRFHVLTVPTTVVLDPAGEVVAVNQGFAPAPRLIQQIQSPPA